MVLCSESEGSPTSVKEALACNIPVVSTNVGDVADIMDGIEGCEICEAVPESLAAGLRRVLYRQGPAFESRAAMRKYDQRSVTDAVSGLYRAVLDRRRCAVRGPHSTRQPSDTTAVSDLSGKEDSREGGPGGAKL